MLFDIASLMIEISFFGEFDRFFFFTCCDKFDDIKEFTADFYSHMVDSFSKYPQKSKSTI